MQSEGPGSNAGRSIILSGVFCIFLSPTVQTPGQSEIRAFSPVHIIYNSLFIVVLAVKTAKSVKVTAPVNITTLSRVVCRKPCSCFRILLRDILHTLPHFKTFECALVQLNTSKPNGLDVSVVPVHASALSNREPSLWTLWLMYPCLGDT